MNLLSIDTSTEQASVALLVNGVVACEEQGSQKTHAQILLPMIDRLIVNSGSSLNQLTGIVFGCGPGSFTGLRIACSIAKGLAYAHDLDLIPVSSLAAIAWAARKQVNELGMPVLSVLDARMNELYWAFYTTHYQALEQVSPAQDIQIVDQSSSIILAGTGLESYWDRIPEQVKTKVIHQLPLFPSAVAMIELVCSLDMKPVSIGKAQPVYVRNKVTQGDSRG
jgi:tRNA threonylcarbamoyladenosine biosynthesis protein TsaB